MYGGMYSLLYFSTTNCESVAKDTLSLRSELE